ncbi:hypothetical protein Ancab_019634, partial [Ancistrocladus abbreviatus]
LLSEKGSEDIQPGDREPVAVRKLFKALCLDNHNVFPKQMPESFKSIEFVECTSATVRSIRQLNVHILATSEDVIMIVLTDRHFSVLNHILMPGTTLE